MAEILIVDDERGIRDLLAEVLDEEGHEVVQAESAAAAQAVRDSKEPDLVLLDIWMPDMDGISLLKEWSRRGLLTMPVIMMSGHATIETALEATRIGAVDYLEKPIALAKLLKTVSAALERSESQRTWRKAVHAAQKLVQDQQQASLVEFQLDTEAAAREALMALDLSLPLRELRDAFEKIYFEFHLEREGGNMTRLAERSGLERTHLYRKIRQLGIEPGKSAGRNKAAA